MHSTGPDGLVRRVLTDASTVGHVASHHFVMGTEWVERFLAV